MALSDLPSRIDSSLIFLKAMSISLNFSNRKHADTQNTLLNKSSSNIQTRQLITDQNSLILSQPLHNNYLQLLQLTTMKKYSSFVDLKLSSSSRGYPPQYWPPKLIPSPHTKRNDIPSIHLPKQSFIIPMSTKYSAGYLQRKKMFSSKKQNRDINNINPINVNQNTMVNSTKFSMSNRDTKQNNSKQKKIFDETQKIYKKQKIQKFDKNIQMEGKQLPINVKYCRLDVQSPKSNMTKNKDEKSKSKIKDKDKEKSQKYIFIANKNKYKQKKQKQEIALNQCITKYDPQPKNIVIHCTSQLNLHKQIPLQQKKQAKGYYKSTLYSAFFSNNPSTFNQICKNHLIASIDFLTYVKKNKQMIPLNSGKVYLPNTNKKTIIFDLDETLIHCNQNLDIPYDVALEICFPSGARIKAGINIRPYAIECLKQLSKYFQIIVFTASHECYANVIIDYLDPYQQYVSHRFFRQTCYKTQQGFYVKDLRVFGRDLSNILLIDNAAYSYCFQPENGVPIVPFYNNKADMELKEVTSYLKEFVDVKNLRNKNQNYMKLGQYYRYSSPQQLINQLYF